MIQDLTIYILVVNCKVVISKFWLSSSINGTAGDRAWLFFFWLADLPGGLAEGHGWRLLGGKYLKVMKGVSLKWKIYDNDHVHNHYSDKSHRLNDKLFEGCNKENDAWHWFKMWNNNPPSRATTFSRYATTPAVTLQKASRLKSSQFSWYFRGSLWSCDSSIHLTELRQTSCLEMFRKKIWYFQTKNANDLLHLPRFSLLGARPKCSNKVRISKNINAN